MVPPGICEQCSDRLTANENKQQNCTKLKILNLIM